MKLYSRKVLPFRVYYDMRIYGKMRENKKVPKAKNPRALKIIGQTNDYDW